METALMSNIGRKAAIATVAFATVGSTLFGGVALAGDKHDRKDGKDGKDGKHDVKVSQTATGGNARGGDACQALINIGLSLGLLGEGGDQCVAGDASADASNAIGG
jgi:hypothetical protein